MATNKKITDLTELAEVDLAADDVLAIVDISAGTTHKVRKDTLASALSGVSSIAATSPLAVDESTGAVTVSTGTIPVASGGTGATSLTDGGVLLGNGTGAVVAMAVLADGAMIVGDGTTDPVPEAGATLRTSIGVGTGDSPQFTAVNVGAATDTTVARASAGDINVEGNLIYRAGGTDVPVADGGTGASTFTDGGVLLGNGTGAIAAMAVLTDGQMIVGDGTTDPVAESGATLRTSIGVGTGDSPQFTGVNVGAATDTTVTRASAGDINVEGNLIYRAGGTDVPVADGGTGASTASAAATALGVGTGDSPQFTAVNIGAATDTTVARASAGDINVEGNLLYRAGGTDVPVADGGTGASTFTDGGVLLGNGTGAIVAMAVLSNGEMIVGDGTTDPVAESGATLRTSIGVAIGSDVEAYDADILKADTPDNLTKGFSTTVYDNGTQTTGTLTPDQDNGNMQKAVNGGAHTLAVVADDCSMVIQYTNNASAGTLTTSAYTVVDGDDLTTTDGHDFLGYIVISDTFSSLTWKALQ